MKYEYTFYFKSRDTSFTIASDVNIDFRELNEKSCPLTIVDKKGKSLWINMEDVYLILKKEIGESTND